MIPCQAEAACEWLPWCRLMGSCRRITSDADCGPGWILTRERLDGLVSGLVKPRKGNP